MIDFQKIHDIALKKHKNLAELLPTSLAEYEIKKIPDNAILSLMSKCIFRAGFVWKIVDNKWKYFEDTFYNFDIDKVLSIKDDEMDKIMENKNIIRNYKKLVSIQENAKFIKSVQSIQGSFSNLIASWPTENLIGLFDFLKKNGSRLGGMSGQYLIRLIGKDTFILTSDVSQALIKLNLIEKYPSSKKDLQNVQKIFNELHTQSQKPMSHISKILACTID